MESKEIVLVSCPRDSHLEARHIVRNYVIAGAVIGAFPSPFFSGMAVKVLQTRMLYLLCKTYKVSFSENLAKGIVLVIAAGLVGAGLSRAFSLAVPRTSPLGIATHSAAMAVGVGAETYAIGYIVRRHFENGGTLENFDLKIPKEELQQLYRKGMVAARQNVVTKFKPVKSSTT
jgi:uncharacterized protein (DUF697 family)